MAMALPLLLILLLGAPAIYAEDHTVGGSNGWDTGYDYSVWAAGEKFVIGDNLVFKYATNHKVDIVTEANYGSCTTGNPLKTYSGGDTTIPLTVVGPIYFICPVSSHCSQGMKLAVNVTAVTTTPPSGTPPTTTTPPGSSSSPPAGTTTSPPPPPPSGVVGSIGHMSHWMLGFSLVVAIVVMGFMG